MIRHHADAEHLSALAEWFVYASGWLEGEIEESRVTRPADTSFPPEQRIESVVFISAELDAMVMGFRRASDILRTMNPDPGEMPP
jgi:hypothetical protein